MAQNIFIFHTERHFVVVSIRHTSLQIVPSRHSVILQIVPSRHSVINCRAPQHFLRNWVILFYSHFRRSNSSLLHSESNSPAFRRFYFHRTEDDWQLYALVLLKLHVSQGRRALGRLSGWYKHANDELSMQLPSWVCLLGNVLSWLWKTTEPKPRPTKNQVQIISTFANPYGLVIRYSFWRKLADIRQLWALTRWFEPWTREMS